MQDEEFVVILAEDYYNPNEKDSTEAIIPSNNGWEPPPPNTKVIVGVGSYKLEPGSKRKGQFQSHWGL